MSSGIYKHYDVLKQIGAGGFSRVYKAIPKELNQKKRSSIASKDSGDSKKEKQYNVDDLVAIKVVRSRDYDCELRDVAENEVSVMEALLDFKEESISRHFVKIIDVFRERRRVAIVMEYLEGGELFERIISRTKYSELDAANIIRAIIPAMNAMHSKGIVHRDIKPENFVYKYKAREDDADRADGIPEEEGLKLMDFGLSLFLNGRDPHKGALYVGTPGYIAPEVISKGKYSAQSDIFSMGVILYILLSGRMPFAGNNSAVINSKIVAGKFSLRSKNWQNVSTHAKNLISQMLEVDPKKRITGTKILNHPWLNQKKGKRPLLNLNLTLDRLKEFHANYKIGDNIRKIFLKASNDLRTNMFNLIEKVNPTGFTLDDLSKIKEAFMDDTNKLQNPDVTRGTFKETMPKLGFKDLPLDEIFDAILEDKRISLDGTSADNFPDALSEPSIQTTRHMNKFAPGKNLLALGKKHKQNQRFSKLRIFRQSIKRKSKERTANKSLADRSVQNKLLVPARVAAPDRDLDTIKLDELLVGLSTVAASESTETFLRFLFNVFVPNTEPTTYRAAGFHKVAKVLANYSKDKDADDQTTRRRAIARNLSLLFTSDSKSSSEPGDEDRDNEEESAGVRASSYAPVKFDDFHAGIVKLGKDLLEEYVTPHWIRISEGLSTGENVVSKGVAYLKTIGTRVEKVSDKWASNKSKAKQTQPPQAKP